MALPDGGKSSTCTTVTKQYYWHWTDGQRHLYLAYHFCPSVRQKCHIDIMRHTKTKIIIINNRPTLTLHKKLKLKYLIHIAVTSLSQ